jgi:hypothetical protein
MKERKEDSMTNYHKVYKFGNGYGASVVCGDMTYGGKNGFFEVAVLDAAGEIVYDTPVTGDVIGWLDFDGVAKVLREIQNLPKKTDV